MIVGGAVMRKLKLILALVITVALGVLVTQNTAPVETRFLWMSAQVPAILLLFLTTAGGFALGLLVALLAGRRRHGR